MSYEFFYLTGLILFGIYFGVFVDARISILERINKGEKRSYPLWITNDWFYLISPFVIFSIILISLYGAKMSLFDFIVFTTSGALLSSTLWDCAFGILVYKDAFFPFRKWLFRMGFGGYRWQRIIADAGRVTVGLLLLIIRYKIGD